jgi:2-phosphoglycerate kinase
MILNPPRTYYKEAVINTLHVKPDLINKRKPIGENVVEVANVMIRSEESERSRVI